MSDPKTVSIFVDVQNIYYTTRQQYKRNFDYNKFWRIITENRIVKNAIAYATDRDDKKQKEFQNILRGIGFDVKLKPYIQRSDGTAKADWDVGITIDVMEYAKNSDIIVLASGDGDFDMLLSHVKQRHDTKFELNSVENLTSISLIREASRYFPITDDLLLK